MDAMQNARTPTKVQILTPPCVGMLKCQGTLGGDDVQIMAVEHGQVCIAPSRCTTPHQPSTSPAAPAGLPSAGKGLYSPRAAPSDVLACEESKVHYWVIYIGIKTHTSATRRSYTCWKTMPQSVLGQDTGNSVCRERHMDHSTLQRPARPANPLTWHLRLPRRAVAEAEATALWILLLLSTNGGWDTGPTCDNAGPDPICLCYGGSIGNSTPLHMHGTRHNCRSVQ